MTRDRGIVVVTGAGGLLDRVAGDDDCRVTVWCHAKSFAVARPSVSRSVGKCDNAADGVSKTRGFDRDNTITRNVLFGIEHRESHRTADVVGKLYGFAGP